MKILFVLSRVPYPLDKGDKLRAFNQMKSLSKEHNISLFCTSYSTINQSTISHLKAFCDDIYIAKLSVIPMICNLFISLLKLHPFQIGYFYNRKIKRQYQEFEKQINPDLVFCQFVRTAPLVFDSKHKKMLDFQDALSVNLGRRLKKERILLKPLLFYEWKTMQRYESKMANRFDYYSIISESDLRELCFPHKWKVTIIPNGVDFEYYTPIPKQDKVYDLIFTGNMSYVPNINAAIFLIKHIMPIVWQQLPDTNLLIAGTSPSQKLKNLSSHKIIISGWVDDMRICYAQSRVFIAPMRIGSGLQNKLLEAMAMQIPCITSSLANQALDAEHNSQIMIANNATEFADNIIELLTNPDKSREIALNGAKYVKDNFNWDICSNKIIDTL